MSGQNAGKKKATITWNARYQQSFDNLKHLCTTVPIPAYTNFTRPFKLNTDACGSGLGAVLYQTHDNGTNAVTDSPTRSLTKAETHYPTNKLEFPALQWAMVEKFH